MKFLAILRDSLREAIDAKVFYVMVGLSLLVILLAATVTFTPQPGGQFLMTLASASLMVDTTDLDLNNQDPHELMRLIMGRLHGALFEVREIEPVDAADLPTSKFRVVLQPRINPVKPWGLFQDQEQHIREHFGLLDKWRVAEVLDVSRSKAGNYEVLARPTAAGRRLWPHSFALFFGALPIFGTEQQTLVPPAPEGPPRRQRDKSRVPTGIGVPLALQLYILEDYIVNGIGAWVAILVSIIISAFFIPNMLRKGTIDLLVVKPIHRVTLLVYKYIGGLLFIFLNTALAVGGVWIALSLRSGIWAPAFLWSIVIITFFFAILYAVSTLFGVLTRSPIVAILLTCLVWGALYFVGVTHGFFDGMRQAEIAYRSKHVPRGLATVIGAASSPLGQGPLLVAPLLQAEAQVRGDSPFVHGPQPWFRPMYSEPLFADNQFARVMAAIHFVLPRTRDLTDLTSALLVNDLLFSNQFDARKLRSTTISWGESLTASGIFIALMLGLSCWRFVTRDY